MASCAPFLGAVASCISAQLQPCCLTALPSVALWVQTLSSRSCPAIQVLCLALAPFTGPDPVPDPRMSCPVAEQKRLLRMAECLVLPNSSAGFNVRSPVEARGAVTTSEGYIQEYTLNTPHLPIRQDLGTSSWPVIPVILVGANSILHTCLCGSFCDHLL